jgi:hypothetical protein
MAYSPINTQAYVSAYAGAIAGMAVSGWIVDPTSANYAQVAAIAGAFSEAFDQAWNNATTLNNLELRAIQSVCQNEFAGRGPGSLENPALALSANWTIPAAACAALVLEGDVYLASQGIDPGTPSTGGGDVVTGQITGDLQGGIVDNAGASSPYVTVGGTYTYSGSPDFQAGIGSQLLYVAEGPDKLALVTATITVQGDNVSPYAVYASINEIGANVGFQPDETINSITSATTDFKTFTVTRLVGVNNTSQSEISFGVGVIGGTYGGLPVARFSMTAQIVAEL